MNLACGNWELKGFTWRKLVLDVSFDETNGIYSCYAQEELNGFACKFPDRFKVYYVLSQVSVSSSSTSFIPFFVDELLHSSLSLISPFFMAFPQMNSFFYFLPFVVVPIKNKIK